MPFNRDTAGGGIRRAERESRLVRIRAKLRLLLGQHPLERMDRVQTVRDEILETVRANAWDWQDVERDASTRMQY